MDDLMELIITLISEVVEGNVKTLYLWGDDEDKMYEDIINNLTKENNEEINEWIWENTNIKEEYNLNNSNLTDASKELISKLYNYTMSWYDAALISYGAKPEKFIYKNINDEIIGERLKLINISEYEAVTGANALDEIAYEVENANDFEIYFSKEKPENIKKALFLNTYLPHSFMVIDKYTNKTVGFISIYNENTNYSSILEVSELTYYIYEKYRGYGFATEASKLLLEQYFNGNLKNYVQTDRKFILGVRNNKPICVKISCNSKNISSKKVAEKCGFVYEGTNHYKDFCYDEPQHFLNYYMDTELFKKLL